MGLYALLPARSRLRRYGEKRDGGGVGKLYPNKYDWIVILC